MAILKIARMGTPSLLTSAQPITDPSHPDIARLIQDMIDTLADIGGVGLAAPQVHVPLRLVIYHVPAGRTDPDQDPVPLSVLVNPRLELLSEATEMAWESCLSLPGLTGRVPRAHRVRLTATDPGGAPVVREATGFHARVLQHECDHLDGILYPLRMTDMAEFGFADEVRKALTGSAPPAAPAPAPAPIPTERNRPRD